MAPTGQSLQAWHPTHLVTLTTAGMNEAARKHNREKIVGIRVKLLMIERFGQMLFTKYNLNGIVNDSVTI